MIAYTSVLADLDQARSLADVVFLRLPPRSVALALADRLEDVKVLCPD